jgi:integrase
LTINQKTDAKWLLAKRGEIYRMSRSGAVYQCRVWISTEKKYLRRSLKTTDYETAIVRGEKLILGTHSDISSGKKLFGITLGGLVDEYLKWRKQDVNVDGGITEGRFGTIKSQCRALLRTKSPDLRVAELDKNSFYDWGQMRRQDTPTITPVTIRNETATIGQIFSFAYRNGYSQFPKMIFREIKIAKGDVGKRDIFDREKGEYDRLTSFLRIYVSEKECPDPEQRLQRNKIRDYIYTLSNTCMRTGELRQMTWNDVLGYQEVVDETGKNVCLVKLRIRKETTKVRNERTIIVRGGDYIKRLRSYSPYTEPDNFLFTNKTGTLQLGTRELYKHWDVIMRGIDIPDYKKRKLSYYSLRHFGITLRMDAGVPIADVAYIAGTSSTHIENHYRHVEDEMMVRGAKRNFNQSIEGRFQPVLDNAKM